MERKNLGVIALEVDRTRFARACIIIIIEREDRKTLRVAMGDKDEAVGMVHSYYVAEVGDAGEVPFVEERYVIIIIIIDADETNATKVLGIKVAGCNDVMLTG